MFSVVRFHAGAGAEEGVHLPAIPRKPRGELGTEGERELEAVEYSAGQLVCLFSELVLRMEVKAERKELMSRDAWRLAMRKSFCKMDMIDDYGNLVKE